MRIIHLMLKDLSQILRDRKSLLFLVLMPIIFTLFMGVALGSNTSTDTRLSVAYVTADPGGVLSQQLENLLNDSGAIRLISIPSDQASQAPARVRAGEFSAAVSVPGGFSEQTLAGQSVKLTLVTDETTATGQAVRQVVQSALVRLLSAAEVAQLSATAENDARAFSSTTERQEYLATTATKAMQAWQKPSINLSVEKVERAQVASSGYAQSSPGMLVQFSIFGLVSSAMIVTVERKTRTLQRMLTTSTSRTQIITGHMAAMFVVVMLQAVLLLAMGQFAFGIDYLRQPLAVALVTIGLALWVACLGLFIGVVAKGEEQVVLYSMLAMFFFTALGGAWFSLESTGTVFSAIGHLLPSTWAMTGYQNIIVRGLGASSVLLPCAILLGYAAVFFTLAIWRFKHE